MLGAYLRVRTHAAPWASSALHLRDELDVGIGTSASSAVRSQRELGQSKATSRAGADDEQGRHGRRRRWCARKKRERGGSIVFLQPPRSRP
jgi:hypothetical protein